MEFKSIIGHQRPKKLLSTILQHERLSHALLFSGPRGVGKRTMAVELVKHLFCETRSGCGVCRACLNVEHQNHPDLLLIQSETSIGIDELRTIRKEVNEYPYEASVRVIIIDGAELMTNDAANALLKTLEEPPPFNLFILVTSSEREVPLTVKSRCTRIGFGPLAREELRAYFVNTLKLPEARANLFAAISQGSISAGLFWMEEEHFMMRHRLAEFLLGKGTGFTAASLLSERIAKQVTALPLYFSFLLSLFRDIWLFRHTDDASLVVNNDLKEYIEERPGADHWIESSIKKIEETMRVMEYNINRWLAFERLMLSLMR